MSQPNAEAGRRRWWHGLLAAFGIVRQYPVLFPLGLITLFAQMTYSGVNNIALPKMILKLGVLPPLDGRLTGAITATFLLAETFLRMPFGWLSDRCGRGRVIVGALLLSVPSLLGCGLVSAYQWLFPLRAWDGMMAAALWPSVYAIIGDTVPVRVRANAMGVINMMYLLALFTGGAVAAVVFTVTGGDAQRFFFYGAAFIGAGGLIGLLFFALNPRLSAPHPEVHLEDAERAVVSVGRHVVLLLVSFLQIFAVTLLAPFMFRYITEDLGFNLRQLAVLVGAPVVGIGLLALPLSRVGDRVGKTTVVRVAFSAVAVALWVFAGSQSLPALALTVLVLGLAFSMGVPAWLAIISALAGSKTRGITLAGYGTVQGLASVVGPLISGVIWDRPGGHPHIFLASAASVTIAALLTWVALPEHHPRHTQKQPTTV